MCFDHTTIDTVFDYSVRDPSKYLTFLLEWNGIKTRSVASRPSTYEEFEAKAKNWLNGRRAPNYGNTLFPDMIKSADEFVKHTAHLLFGGYDDNPTSNDSISMQYCKTLMFALLYKLCTERIAVHQSWKKTMLLCENSVKNIHSNTAKLLQKYAIHDYSEKDLNSFPGSLQRAAQFFSEQHNRYLALVLDSYKKLRVSDSMNQKPIVSMSGDVATHRASNILPVPLPIPVAGAAMTNIDGDGTMDYSHTTTTMHSQHHHHHHHDPASNPCVAIKVSDYAAIMHRLSVLERKHCEQATQISQLSAKCVALQSHIAIDYNSNVHPNMPVASISTNSGGVVTEYAGDRKPDISNTSTHSMGLLSSSPSTSQCPSCQTRSTYHSSQHQNQQQQQQQQQSVAALANCNYNFAGILAQPIQTAAAQSSFIAPTRYAPIRSNMANTTHNTVVPVQQLQPHMAPFAVSCNGSSSSGSSGSSSNSNSNIENSHVLFNAPSSSFDYSGLRLQVPFSMFASPKSSLAQHSDNKAPHTNHHEQDEAMTPTDCAMHFMTTSVPNALNQSSYFADSNHSLMLDQGTDTPNANKQQLFTFPPNFTS
eukprot:CAMPEP_0202695148 /NCGR_PEP_ID=MMETSP1385-20130828/8811_1 /ASSEMBLY_ACC=CAM_ASM_000861 /TAXON_ID=933848 /ORGANISM="Elphidium margaritaceum" /LENGTH=590 /DNA_ID=CAMNT_0049351121 /DNA_START=233 /DNA_END=2005 /DNA_ORIENTATION=-